TLQREFMDAIAGADEAQGRLAIYRRNVLGARRGVLEATYPVVLRLVGDAFFGEAARAFALASVSSTGDLADYGREPAAFLDAYPHARALGYLGDVARLEWACHESELAAEVPAFDFAALAAIGAEASGDIRFSLAPSVRLVASIYPVVSIWQ